MSIFDEVEAKEEKAGRGIEKPAKAAPIADPDAELAESAGLTPEELAELRESNARLWPLGQ